MAEQTFAQTEEEAREHRLIGLRKKVDFLWYRLSQAEIREQYDLMDKIMEQYRDCRSDLEEMGVSDEELKENDAFMQRVLDRGGKKY